MTTFQQTHEIIENSAVFKKFKQENQDAELVAGFFILDFLSNDNKDSLDYKLPENKEDNIYTFELDKNKEVIMKQDKLINPEISNQPKLTKILPNIKTDLNEIPSIAQQEAEKNKITSKFHKIIAVLQNYKSENKGREQQIWNLTCMLDQLIILNILINAQTSEIIKFERKSMMDFIKKR
jgi:hypothetical protein